MAPLGLGRVCVRAEHLSPFVSAGFRGLAAGTCGKGLLCSAHDTVSLASVHRRPTHCLHMLSDLRSREVLGGSCAHVSWKVPKILNFRTV